MIANEPYFWNYVTTDEDGFMNGIREDAPDEIKKAYEAYMKKVKKDCMDGIKS